MLELNIKHSILALPLEGLKHRFLYIYIAAYLKKVGVSFKQNIFFGRIKGVTLL